MMQHSLATSERRGWFAAGSQMRLAVPAAFALVLAALTGCSEPRATVSGKVTYKEKGLTGGTVVFVSDDNLRQERTPIQADGTYSSTNVPVGNVRIGVEPAHKNPEANMPKGVPKPKMPTDSSAPNVYGQAGMQYVDIPQALRDPATSKITLKVERGEQVFNIPLKDPN